MRQAAAAIFIAGLFSGIVFAQEPARVRHIAVMGGGAALNVEIQTTGAITPISQAITGPDRIVIDFPGALPASELRSMNVNRGGLKIIRSGLFSKNPPITRVVLDLDSPHAYQVFTTPHAIMLKLTATADTSGVVQAAGSAAGETVPPEQQSKLEVSFRGGLLRIRAQRATLGQVLNEVQRQTGAEIAVPAGAESEEIAADLGPAPARDVLAALLNGSRYNFIFVGNDQGHTLQKAILTVR